MLDLLSYLTGDQACLSPKWLLCFTHKKMVKDSKKKRERHVSLSPLSVLVWYLSGTMPLLKIPQLGTMISYQRSFHTWSPSSKIHHFQPVPHQPICYKVLTLAILLLILDLFIFRQAPHKILNSFLGYNNARFTCCLERDPFFLLERVSFSSFFFLSIMDVESI